MKTRIDASSAWYIEPKLKHKRENAVGFKILMLIDELNVSYFLV